MGFGGAVQDMIAMLKFNKRPQRRVYKNLGDHYEKYKDARKRALRKKEIPVAQLNRVKENIQFSLLAENRRTRFKVAIMLIIAVIISIIVFKFITTWSLNEIEKNQEKEYMENSFKMVDF